MLRITVVELSTSDVTLRVEGHFAGPWVEEVRRTCEAFRGSNPIQLHVELEDVSFIDSAGVAYLKELQKEGAVLAHVSPFLAELFKSDLLPDGFSSE